MGKRGLRVLDEGLNSEGNLVTVSACLMLDIKEIVPLKHHCNNLFLSPVGNRWVKEISE